MSDGHLGALLRAKAGQGKTFMSETLFRIQSAMHQLSTGYFHTRSKPAYTNYRNLKKSKSQISRHPVSFDSVASNGVNSQLNWKLIGDRV